MNTTPVHADLHAGKYADSPMFKEGVAFLEELHPGVQGPILEAAKTADFREFWRALAATMFDHGTTAAGTESFQDMVKKRVKKHDDKKKN